MSAFLEKTRAEVSGKVKALFGRKVSKFEATRREGGLNNKRR
jgi:hypothetical protein